MKIHFTITVSRRERDEYLLDERHWFVESSAGNGELDTVADLVTYLEYLMPFLEADHALDCSAANRAKEKA